jgi:hypothetical protein
VWLARGRTVARWDHTSHLLAAILNSRMGVTKMISAAECNPTKKRSEPMKLNRDEWREMRAATRKKNTNRSKD